MKVFLSWSGDLSREVAELMRKLMPLMLRGVEVFMSKHDISSGERWGVALAKTLAESDFGILLLTRSNLASPWLLFEAGALGKLDQARVCCLVLGDLSPAEVQPPLSQFQNRRFSKTDVRQLFADINLDAGSGLESDQFDLVFEKWWPDFDSAYRGALLSVAKQAPMAPARRSEDLLQEILLTVRELSRQRMAGSLNAALQHPLSAHADLLSQQVSESSLAAYTEWKLPGKGLSERWQRQMLRDLDLSRYPTIRHIDDAFEYARPAVAAYAVEAPELFPTGTDYITKALGFADAEFRSHHNFGLSTRTAFDRFASLLKPA